MAGESFPFTSSALRALRLQREWLEWEDRRRAAAQRCRSHRDPAAARVRLARPRRRCCDPAVHSALFTGDLQQVQALFRDEEAANVIVETVSNQLAWSAEQGRPGAGAGRHVAGVFSGAVSFFGPGVTLALCVVGDRSATRLR